MHADAATERDDRVLPATRVLGAVIIPFLVAAFLILYGVPDRTEQLFAWTINSSMTSMTLAAAYLSGVWFFTDVCRSRRWHTVAGGFPGVAAFASVLGTATFLHWDRFNHDHVAFWVWATFYTVTPFLVVAAWWVNGRTLRPAGPADVVLSHPARAVLAVTGGAAVAVAVFLLLAPATAVNIWPWPLTPLTARVVAAVFALGLAGPMAAFDGRWSAVRPMLRVAALMLAAILLAAARARGEFDPANPLTWVLLASGAVGLVAALAAEVAMARRPGTVTADIEPDRGER